MKVKRKPKRETDMRRMTKSNSLFLIATFCATATVGSAALQADDIAKAVAEKAERVIKTVEKSCAADIKEFCSKVTPGEGRLLLCMAAHEDKISDGCFTTLLDVGDSIELSLSSVKRAASVCANEIDTLCANVDAGEGRIAQCLIDNRSKLSAPCSAEVAGVEARIKN
jgi:Golgi apparatus protein 1